MTGVELLDDPRGDPVAVEHELQDIARLNALFGGTRAVVRELERLFEKGKREGGTRGTGGTWTLLDVGTGLGDIPRAAAKAAKRRGISLRIIGVEINRAAAASAIRADRSGQLRVVLADGNALPFAPRSVDVVIVSQVLHHLSSETVTRWITGLAALARRGVVLADLRRSRVAMAAVWLASFPLGFDATTRHDAVLSLRRGYTSAEMNALLEAGGAPRVARRRPGFRIVAAWEV
jgi:hypothetical protein